MTPDEKPLTVECPRCYSTTVVPILSFGRGPRGDHTVGCAACGETWRASDADTAAVVAAEDAWNESQREIDALSAPPVTRADYLARLAAMTQTYERANEGVILGVNIEFDETSAFGWDGETMGPCDPLHVTVATATDARVEARDARIAALEAALGWMPLSIREAIRTGNVDAAKEWATRGESFAADQQAIINSLRGKVADMEREKAALERQVALTAHDAGEAVRVMQAACESTEKQRDALAAGLRDALEALGDMSGFVEAQFYAEKYGVREMMARLKILLPPEDSRATEVQRTSADSKNPTTTPTAPAATTGSKD